ncbi:helix-turn-helix transcriptional regulator [Romeria aff. gracilis LEGE 07310]|uniref:Helix-turn-helix transcriptional regulator n=2 Tax=Vasconcelosia TaxID=3366328 RepID=A0A8J7A8D1_9CYAN|nr:helix-turn-helix transcriptional regulator [Romeria aff. gracilis LEGE 07310]
MEDWAADQQISRVQVCFDPAEFLQSFSPAQLAALPVEIQRAATGERIQPYYYQGAMTAAMQTVVHQILHCPYQGLMRRLFLESKALELLTLRFCQFTEQAQTSTQKSELKPDDIERIHQARNILINQFDQPPTLIELARQVAINDHKLKQGFRQVFGTTVFGYLHNYRLEKAQHLLAAGERVIDVTHKIGFADRSHFAVAFRKKFGLNPGEYARQRRHNSKGA